MRMLKAACVISVLALLTACQANGVKYRYKDTFYDSAQGAQLAQTNYHTMALDAVEPMPEPINSKTLVFGLPSYETLKGFWYKHYEGQNVRNSDKDFYSLQTYRGMKALYDIVKKSNLYSETKLVETSGGDLQPSENTDVLYIFAKSMSHNAMYFSNQSNGKQVWAFDKAIQEPDKRSKAVMDSVTAFAVQ